MRTYIEQYLDTLPAFEGTSQTMYLDTAGNVTVGIGKMLGTADDAAKLLFHVMQNGINAEASVGLITAEWNRVKAMGPGLKAAAYATAASPFLLTSDILAMARMDILTVDHALYLKYPERQSWPDQAKLATLDMGYNLGVGRLISEYPHFNEAVALAPTSPAQWLVAAHECGRNTSQKGFAQRNAWTAQLFKAAYDSIAKPAAA